MIRSFRRLVEDAPLDKMAEAAATGPPTPPEKLKFISPLLQRAHELKVREPVVAYYCTRYALELALPKATKAKESQLFKVHLLDGLEQDKKALAGNEAITNDLVGYAHIENFALKIFLMADNEDRQGQASRKTAKTFLAASIFLELLKTFGKLDPEIEEKIKYAKWKATDIMKAIREGRQPMSGPPGGDNAVDEMSVATSFASAPNVNNQNFSMVNNSPPNIASNVWQPQQQPQHQFVYPASLQNPAFPQTPSSIGQGIGNQIPPGTPASSHTHASVPPNIANFYHQSNNPENPVPPPTIPGDHANLHSYQHPHPYPSTSSPYSNAEHPNPIPLPRENRHVVPAISTVPSMPSPVLDHKIVVAATKHARYVVSALQYDDVKTAVDNLRKALELLEPYNK